MTYEWSWPAETWFEENQRFARLAYGGRHFTVGVDDLDRFAVKVCPRESCTQHCFPKAFSYCPWCGSRLLAAVESLPFGWSPPYGNADGTHVFLDYSWEPATQSSAKMVAVHEEFELPDAGRFSFLVTRQGDVLLAIDREHGRLSCYSVTTCKWRDYGEIPPATHSLGKPWTWSAVPGSEGFAVPTVEGPCWVLAPSREGRFSCEILKADGPVHALGGAGAVSDVLMMPLSLAGRLAVAWRAGLQEGSWQLQALEVDWSAGENLGIPVRNRGGELFWAGGAGYLAVRVESGLPQVRWNAWSEGISGLLQYPPYRDGFGSVWQQGNHHNRYVFEKLVFDPAGRQVRPVRRVHLSGGTFTFSMKRRYEEPWEEEEQSLDYAPKREALIHPLLALDSGLIYFRSDRPLTVPSYVERRLEHPVEGDLLWRRQGGGDTFLLNNLQLTNPWDAALFLYNRSLYLYIESQGQCWRWKS